MQFDAAWWAAAAGGRQFLGLIQPAGGGDPFVDRGLFTYFLNLHAITGANVLMTFGLGRAADAAETMDDDAVRSPARGPRCCPVGLKSRISPGLIVGFRLIRDSDRWM